MELHCKLLWQISTDWKQHLFDTVLKVNSVGFKKEVFFAELLDWTSLCC